MLIGGFILQNDDTDDVLFGPHLQDKTAKTNQIMKECGKNTLSTFSHIKASNS